MWSDDQFKTFLSSQGREAQWQTVVVPGMKKAIIHALQTTQDLMESRKNTFELYGADFMLGRMSSLSMAITLQYFLCAFTVKTKEKSSLVRYFMSCRT